MAVVHPIVSLPYEPSYPLSSLNPFLTGVEEKTLGEGTYGKVVAYRLPGGNQVAVKISKIVGVNYTDLVEAGIMVRLHHRNVQSILSIGFRLGKFFSTMELAAGTLHDFIKRETMTDDQKLSFVYQIFCGVGYCLSRNVLHRDLKPQNILITSDGDLKIADFGLAVSLSCVPQTELSTNVVTRWYRSPEVLLGDTRYQGGIDKWSVGCIIYEIYRGYVAFDADSDAEQLEKIYYTISVPKGDALAFLRGLPEWSEDLYKLGLQQNEEHLQTTNLGQPTFVVFPILKKLAPKIWEMTTSLLDYLPSRRGSLIDFQKDPVFDSVRDPSGEISRSYNCLENLELRALTPEECDTVKDRDDYKRKLSHAIITHKERYGLKRDSRVYLQALNIYRRIRCKSSAKVEAAKDEYQIAALALAFLWYDTNPGVDLPYLHNRAILLAARDITTTLQCDFLQSNAYDFLYEYLELYPFKNQRPLMINFSLFEFVHGLSLIPSFVIITPKELGLLILLVICITRDEKFLHYSYLTTLVWLLDVVTGEVESSTVISSKMKKFMAEIKAKPISLDKFGTPLVVVDSDLDAKLDLD